MTKCKYAVKRWTHIVDNVNKQNYTSEWQFEPVPGNTEL